jgi:hypothetical protein
MKRINHTIRRKKIPEVKLVSLTGKTWYDSNDTPTSWTGPTDFLATGFTPDTGFLVFNVTGGTVTSGYYKWNTPTANTWNLITSITGTTPEQIKKEIDQQVFDDFQLPLFLEATADEMGDMVDFDKNIGHNKISTNFTYNSDCIDNDMTITIDNTTTYQLVNIIQANNTNPDGSPIEDITFTVYWGDDTTSLIGINGTTSKTFSNINEKTVTIVFDSPYLTNQITKVVNCGDTYVVATELEEPIQTSNDEQDNLLKIE